MNRRNLISSKMGIIIGIIIALILTYFGISYWISTLIALIVIIILANTSTVDSGSGSTAGESNAYQQQVGTPSKDYMGSIISIIFLALVIVVYLWADAGLKEEPDVTFYGSGLLPRVIKGDCKVVNNVLFCKGGWELTIPAGKAIEVLKIQPNNGFSNLSQNLTIWSGNGKKQFVYRFSQTTQRCDGLTNPHKEIFYNGEIFYGTVPDYGCLEVSSEEMEQEPLKLALRWYCPFITSGSCHIPSMFIGEKTIAYPIKDKEEVFGSGGDIHILSDLDAEIMRIEVIYKKI